MPKRKGIHSSEDLREDLECPVCLSIPKKGPIYQCESGHIHCNACHSGLRECPICRGPVGNTRCLAIEKVIAKLPTKCKFNEYGCISEEKLPDEMMEHEKICYFRLVNCLVCNEQITLPDLYDHLKLKHGYNAKMFKNPATATMKKSKETSSSHRFIWFMRTRKHTFVLMEKEDDAKCFNFFAFILGSQNDIDEEEYTFEMEVTSRKSVGSLSMHLNHLPTHFAIY